MMELVNAMSAYKGSNGAVLQDAAEKLLIMLSPFAPHIADELWQLTGHADVVYNTPWPAYNEEYMLQNEVEIAVQINGKLKTRLTIPTNLDKAAAEAHVRSLPDFAKWLGDKQAVKIIIVPDKLVNIVAK